MLIGIVMWYPFLKIADKKEYELEMAAEKKQASEAAKMTEKVVEEIQA
jgi:PTS system cellobiose-specific IIC component